MKKLFSCLAVALLAIVSIANAQTTIYSYRSWQNVSGNAETGPIKYPSDNPRAVTLIANQSKMGHVYAGAYCNYKWYAQVTKPGTQSTLEGLYTIDIETGERTLIAKNGSQLADMTYDYESNVMYGLRTTKTLVKVNLTTGALATVGSFKTSGGTAAEMLAIACDANHQMYGVSPDGNFYKIDKTTAVVSAVGVLGAAPAFTQSMEFDRYTNRLYWANNGDYILYEINISTGEATPIQFIGVEGYDSTNSMFIPWINAPVGSPDRVLGRKSIANGDNVTISWVNPSVDIQGNAMADFSGVKIYRDETLVATISYTIADAGKTVSYVDNGVSAGSHKYKIVPFNSKGEGGVDTDPLAAYVGKNAPGAVVNFKVEQGDSKAVLSWEAPVEGMFGGEYDPASVTKYVVTRTSGSINTTFVTTATTYTDAPSFGTYTYSVYAVNEVGNGVVSTSEPIMVKPADWIVMMTGETTVEAGKTYTFYDAGGPNANYPNSEIDTLVIRPANVNGVVKVEFEKLDIEPQYDYLTIFNGGGANVSKIGAYSSDEVPFDLLSLESTSSDGALTFVFESDIMYNYTGWVAKVTALEKKEYDLVMTAFNGELYVEQGKTSKYIVKVQNKGISTVGASEYKVVLKGAGGAVLAQANGVDVAPMTEVEIILETTHGNTGELALTAVIEYAKDADVANNTADMVVNVIVEGSKFVVIGDGAEGLIVCPASFMSHQSVSQTLYYANEIGVENAILKMISFPYYEVTTSYPNVPVKVWVAETDRTDLKASNLKSDEMTLVFDGNVPVMTTDKEWTIQLNDEFMYNGGNLAIMVYKDAPGTQFEGVSFLGDFNYDDSSAPLRTRFDSPWDETESIDHNALFGWDSEKHLPTTKLLFLPAAGVGAITADNTNVMVYPNPVASVLCIDAEVVSAKLVSLTGQVVAEVENDNKLNVTDLPAGIYVLMAATIDGEVVKTKVVKK